MATTLPNVERMRSIMLAVPTAVLQHIRKSGGHSCCRPHKELNDGGCSVTADQSDQTSLDLHSIRPENAGLVGGIGRFKCD